MSIEEYLANVDPKWQDALLALKKVIDENIPEGFELEMQYGMPSYVVPLSIYPNGYHCKKDTALPFIGIAARKNHIGLYHMGLYGSQKLLHWFEEEYPKHTSTKLNMGKSCVRFSNPKKIPYNLIGELVRKMDVQEWIRVYEG
ncbi:DUF1801 domain-containing protein [Mangrovibacillus cuniculi]|nr:DUF1801 domain-containing protein [Mangrovibacillus cuniculi]